MKNEMELKVKGVAENESFVRAVVAAFVAQLNPTMEELADVRTAVSEAVTNAVIHGYESMEGSIRVSVAISGCTVDIRIADEGKGIENVEQAMEPFYTSRPEMERSGMGFSFMEAFMDALHIESAPGKGTKITMRKVIGKSCESDT